MLQTQPWVQMSDLEILWLWLVTQSGAREVGDPRSSPFGHRMGELTHLQEPLSNGLFSHSADMKSVTGGLWESYKVTFQEGKAYGEGELGRGCVAAQEDRRWPSVGSPYGVPAPQTVGWSLNRSH